MAATAVVARNLLNNSKSLPLILRGQILGLSNVVAKDHQIVQSLFVSNQKIAAQIPIFDFSEMGSLLGSSGGPSLVAKGNGYGIGDLVIEARGKRVVMDEDDDEFVDDDDDDGEFEGDDFDDEDADDMVDDDDFDNDDDDDDEDGDGGRFDDGKHKKKFY